MSEKLLEKIRNADNLPSLPTVAIEVLRLSRNQDTSIDELVGVIQKDPALTVKILRTVNSALFSIPHEISSLRQAVSMLGLRSVKMMALSFSLVETFKNHEEDGFDFETYWRRSLSCAAAARLIAKVVIPGHAEEAFVCGLLTDLGIIAAWRSAPELYQPVLNAWTSNDQPLEQIEQKILGITHARMTYELLRTWELPEILCHAVSAHHGEGLEKLSGPAFNLANVIYSAATVASLFCREIVFGELDQVREQVCQVTGIKQSSLEEILDALDKHVRDTASMLSLQVGQTLDYTQIQAQASAQLAQLSMQAEMERMESTKRELEAKSEVTRLHGEKKAILEVASTDGLTKLANRAAFDKRLEEELAHACSEGHQIGLIVLDLDHFKLFNDTYGHQTGDEVLRHAAACLREVAGHGAFPARYGGEEFVVIVVQKTAREILDLAEEIRSAIASRPLTYQGSQLNVTASLGAIHVASPTSVLTSQELVGQADRNLYRAKHAGRNCVKM